MVLAGFGRFWLISGGFGWFHDLVATELELRITR